MLHKLMLLTNSLHGYLQKWLIDLNIYRVPNLRTESFAQDIVISLTSYGRRVSSNVVYYTIVSLLRQSIQPERIILWLAEDEWNDNTIPAKLANLKNKGVEIRYCQDLRSYKKLVPTIELCPGKSIVTVDDDVIYSTDLLASMLHTHREYPNDVICLNSIKPELTNGIPKGYKTWNDYEGPTSSMLVFPVGVGGTMYPAGSLHPDVTKRDLFQKLCPTTDDIWFWFCGLRNGTMKHYIYKKKSDTSFDRIYQVTHSGSALTHSNKFEDKNDKQFHDLFTYYNVHLTNEGKLI